MKKDVKLLLLAAIVAAQLLWLGINYYLRGVELENAPALHLPCNEYDPRDILRGDYINIRLPLDIPLDKAGVSLYWGKELCNGLNTYSVWETDLSNSEGKSKYVPYTVENLLEPRAPQAPDAVELTTENKPTPLAVFWRKGDDGFHAISRVEAPGTAADAPQDGELRCLMWGRIINEIESPDSGLHPRRRDTDIYLKFRRHSWVDMRYYVQEKTGNLRRIWETELGHEFDTFPAHRIRYTIDLALRENNIPAPRMLYLNGIPYPQAVELIRAGTFPWLPEQDKQTK